MGNALNAQRFSWTVAKAISLGSRYLGLTGIALIGHLVLAVITLVLVLVTVVPA